MNALMQGQSEALTFWTAASHFDPIHLPAGKSCARDGGRWLLQLERMDGDYEGRQLYIEAVEQEGALAPVGVGLLFATCTGFYWIPDLGGTLLLDSSVEGRVRVRAEIRGELHGDRHSFVGDFLIHPGEGCEELEQPLAAWGLR